MNKEPDVLGITWWTKADGTRQYQSRGIGEKYDELYRWLPKTSYKCTGEDFPWDYFVFDNPTDHDVLCEKFGADVWHNPEWDEVI